jgi:hypothetical protein
MSTDVQPEAVATIPRCLLCNRPIVRPTAELVIIDATTDQPKTVLVHPSCRHRALTRRGAEHRGSQRKRWRHAVTGEE